jgi:hypothetical protein
MFILVFVAVFCMFTGMAMAVSTANVTQVGNNNEATTSQTGTNDTANTTQYGSNRGDVTQSGNNNNATINQGTLAVPVTNLSLPGYNGDWMHGAFIKQSGNNNDATINMKGNSDYAHIYQTGDRNIGFQDIGTEQSKANGNLLGQVVGPHYGVTIDQTGNDNKAYQTTKASYGCYGIQDMRITQTGNTNTSNQTSIGGMQSVMDAFLTGNLNLTTQYADGMVDRNTVNINGNSNVTDQEQPYVLWGTTTRIATIDITGDSNVVNQTQSGTGDVSHSTITGSFNHVTQTQTGGNGNSATVVQSGNSNTASQIQTGNNNTVSISQTGGNLNQAYQAQTGDGNLATVVQNGSLNYASQSQIGNGFVSVVIQTGNGNFSLVTQH